MMHVLVLLGDPELPYPYNLTNRYEARDFEAVKQLKAALSRLSGYRFTYLDDHENLIESLRRQKSDFLFNRCDTGYRNLASLGPHLAHLLDMLGLRPTGPSADTLVLCASKHLIHMIAAHAGIPVPEQRVIRLDEALDIPDAPYPGLIKPCLGYGSAGVYPDSVVRDPAAARPVLTRLRDELGFRLAVLEEYLPGPEYSAAAVGNGAGLRVLPPLELDYSELPSSLPPVLPYEAKVDPNSLYWTRVHLRPARLSQAKRDALESHCRAAFDAFGCRDHTRFDFRCDREGRPRLIDVNPDPSWYPGGMLASMAGYAGYDYPAFVRLLLETGRERIGL